MKGIEQGATPIDRLSRKFAEFKRRTSSIDVYEEPARPANPDALRTVRGSSTSLRQEPVAKSAAPKMAIFKDDGPSGSTAFPEDGAWNDIGSIEFRRKENVAVEKMAGAILPQAEKSIPVSQDIKIFKDHVRFILGISTWLIFCSKCLPRKCQKKRLKRRNNS